uniref:PsunGV_gp111 n=1 Tax=Cnaphalocrocis medinalis granulovirus TaxID=1750712 RepID=A0A0X9GJT6_9BBAC|nr:PsunGV_gp111 [Cnaphalocrocis medinalis granulovirus]
MCRKIFCVTLLLFLLLINTPKAVLGGELTSTFLDLAGKVYKAVEESNTPDQACFMFYTDIEFRGESYRVCTTRGKCVPIPIEGVSSVRFLSGGRFFSVQKLYLFTMDNCKVLLDTEGYDTYNSHTTVYNDGYHNCDGFDLSSNWCSNGDFNDNVVAFLFV